MRNAKKLRELADIIDGSAHVEQLYAGCFPEGIAFGFNMSKFAHQVRVREGSEDPTCGTVGCIAGYAVQFMGTGIRFTGDEVHDDALICSISGEAAEILGLDGDESDDLFCPQEIECSYSSITPEEAANVLRLVADGADIEEAWEDVFDERD